MKCPTEVLWQIVEFCETRRDLSSFVATRRRMHGELEEYLYRREYFATEAMEYDASNAIWDAAKDAAKIATLKKWFQCIPARSEFEVDRKLQYLARALGLAAGAGSADAVRLLLDHGAPKVFDAYQSGNPLELALHFGHLDVAKELIEAGCGASQTSYADPMMTACGLGDEAIEIVQMLLDRGMDPYYNADISSFSLSYSAPTEAVRSGSVGLL